MSVAHLEQVTGLRLAGVQLQRKAEVAYLSRHPRRDRRAQEAAEKLP